MWSLCLVFVVGGIGVWGLYNVARAFKTGDITNFFGSSNHTVYRSQNPTRFVGSMVGWAVVGALCMFFAGNLAVSLQPQLYALIPSYAGPVAALYLLVTRGEKKIPMTNEAVIEAVVSGNEREARTIAAVLVDGPRRRLLAGIRDAEFERYRGGARPDLTTLGSLERIELSRLTHRTLPAALAIVAPALWLATSFTSQNRDAEWLAAAVALALVLPAVYLRHRQALAVTTFTRALRDRLC